MTERLWAAAVAGRVIMRPMPGANFSSRRNSEGLLQFLGESLQRKDGANSSLIIRSSPQLRKMRHKNK